MDGDGFTPGDGDCWDAVAGPDGTALEGADIHPGATEIWYDGIDGDCASDDDFDADKDGFVRAGDEGVATAGVAGSGELPAGDCWDDPDDAPAEMEPLKGFPPLTATDVNPAAGDAWYDGVDQDCDGGGDFDQDGDGYDSAWFEQRDGTTGDDCFDAATDAFVNDAALDPASVFPGAADTWYDGTDQNCDGNEFDQDGDGYVRDEECDDLDPEIFPNGETELWYDCIDQNCDGIDGDQDGDGYVSDDPAYIKACPAWKDANQGRPGGDCWDDPSSTPTDLEVIAGFDPLTADVANPGAVERWYDAADQDCDGHDDFDQDYDDERSLYHPDGLGAVGDDCFDDLDDVADFGFVNGEGLSPDEVNTSESEVWYLGTDQNCDGYEYDQDYDGFDYDGTGGTDCDDADPAIHPTATEVASDDVDQDCDGKELCYVDADDDTYRSSASAVNGSDTDCNDVGEWETASGSTGIDCDDGESSVHPGATEVEGNGDDEDCDGSEICYVDADHDGARTDTTVATSDEACDDAGHALETAPDDCDDGDAGRYPGLTEVVNDGKDQDCDTVDACYQDDDDDNFGTTTVIDSADLDCADADEATVSTDCDDAAGNRYPGNAEVIDDGIDEDCDGVDACYQDADNDNFGTTTVIDSLDLDCADSNEATVSTDCDDTTSNRYPGKTEVVNDGIDQDCNDVDACYQDADNDNFGTTIVIDSLDLDCADSNEATVSTDCDDASSSDYPGATETTDNGDDDDCDGSEICYLDADDDGYRPNTTATKSSADADCNDATEAHTADPTTDCDDADDTIHPGITDDDGVLGVDDDCDDYIDEDGVTFGDVIFTELQIHPTTATFEWFEIYNNSGHTLWLDGWEVSQGVDRFCVSPDLASLPDGEYAVFCNGAPTGVACDYNYNSNTLSDFPGGCASDDGSANIDLDDTDSLVLDLDGATVDDVTWNGGTWSYINNVTKMLKLPDYDATLNNALVNWCNGQTEYAVGYKGTPGADSDCP